MSERIEAILATLIRNEGTAYTNRKSDRGGPTKCGITLATLQRLKRDLNGDGKIDEEDVKLVTVPIAEEIYRHVYWQEPHFDHLVEEVQPVLVDFGVNSGPANATIALQRVLEKVRQTAPELDLPYIKPDGSCGPATQSACAKAELAMGGFLVNALCEERERFLRAIVAHSPDQAPNLKGWVNRARSFRIPV